MGFLAAALDENVLRFERLVLQSVDKPVDDERTRARVADGVPFPFKNIKKLSSRDIPYQLVDKLHVTMLVVLAGNDHVGARYLGRDAFQSKGLGKLIEGCFVVIARHV